MLTYSSWGCDKTLTVGVGQPWAPYIFAAKRPPHKGIDIEATQLLLSYAGFCSKFIRFPSSARGLAELEKGTVDILPAASFSEQRAKYSYFTIPYRNEKMRLFWYENTDGITADLVELMNSKHTFAINSGAFYGEQFAKLKSDNDYKKLLISVPKIRQRLYLLAAGRVDFMIDDELSGRYLITQEKISGVTLHPYVINDNLIHFMLSKKTMSVSEVTKINAAIVENKSAVQDIINQYVD